MFSSAISVEKIKSNGGLFLKTKTKKKEREKEREKVSRLQEIRQIPGLSDIRAYPKP